MAAALDRDPLFIAMTRPQMFAGVTYNLFVLNGVFTLELFLITHTPLVLAAFGVVHAAASAACAREPRILDLWIARIVHCPPARNRRFWRCNSYAA